MGVNHVEFSNGETVVDLRHDTINPDVVFQGYTGHDAQGNPFKGRANPQGNGETVQEIMWVTAEFSFMTLQVTNFSHTYAEILSAAKNNKEIKMKLSYVNPFDGISKTAIGSLALFDDGNSSLQFIVFVRENLGEAYYLYCFTVYLDNMDETSVNAKIVNTTSVG